MIMRKKGYKGSTLILTIIFIAVLFIISTAILELAMSSFKLSKGYYAKNRTYYDAESAFERIVYYIDMVADKARQMANSYVFLDSGSLNVSNPEVKDILEDFHNKESQYYMQLTDGGITQADYDQKMDDLKKDYEQKVTELFTKKFKLYIKNFFDGTSSPRPALEFTVGGSTYTVDSWNGVNSLYNFIQMIDFNNPDVKIEVKDPTGSIPNGINVNYHDLPSEIDKPIDVSMYVVANLLKDNVKRVLRADFQIIPYRKTALNFSTRTIKRGFNRILDYSVFAGKNLIVVNGNNSLNIKGGKVYVRGTSNDVRVSNPSENFGGILSGINLQQIGLLKSSSRINPISDFVKNKLEYFVNNRGSSNAIGGIVNIEANVYAGYSDLNPSPPSGTTDLTTKYSLYGGFVKTCAPGSQINIKGDLYSHSIVTENNAQNSSISVDGSVYLMDNVSMYAQYSNIDISGSLIGLGTGDTPYNYNSCASIVINDNTAKLNIGRNIVLMGVAFVDEIHRTDESGQDKLFRMPESSSLIPNFSIYQYFNLPRDELNTILTSLGLNNNLNGYSPLDLFSSSYFKSFNVKVSPTDEVPVDLYDMDVSGPERAINFVLHYLTAHKKDPDDFDTEYNLGNNITVGGGNITFNPSNIYDSSYFHYFLNANGKIYLARSILNLFNENEIENTIGSRGDKTFVNLGSGISSDSLRNEIDQNIIKPKLMEFIEELNLLSKGLLDTSRDKFDLDDFVDFSAITADPLVIADGENLIVISNGNIDIDLGSSTWNGIPINNVKNVLLVAKGDIVIDNSSAGTTKELYGNIIAGGDVIVGGNGSIILNYKKSVSTELMYYFNYSNFDAISDKLSQLYNFFIKGVDTNNLVEIPFVNTFFENAVKTNIKVLSKRQIATN